MQIINDLGHMRRNLSIKAESLTLVLFLARATRNRIAKLSIHCSGINSVVTEK